MSPHDHGDQAVAVVEEPAAAGSGRGPARESAICTAALELLAEVGYEQMSMDAVAARARASKATIYRRWPGKQELVVHAIRCRGPQAVELPDTGSLRGDIIATLRRVQDGIGAQDVALLAGVLRAMRGSPEIADLLRKQMLDEKRELSRTIVQRAIGRGELGPAADPEMFHEVAPALMFFRVLVTGEPIDEDFLAHAADDVLIPLLACSGARHSATSARQETS
jgi:AcrR family transcriptional regulator